MEQFDNLHGDEKKNEKLFLYSCIAYFVSMLLFVGLRVASGLGFFEMLADGVGETATDVIATAIIQIILFFIVPLVIMKSLTKQPMRKTLADIGFDRPSGKVIGYSFLLGVLLYVLNIFVASVSIAILILIGYRMPVGSSSYVGITGLLISLVIVGVLPGVCEETSNRGVLMQGLVSKLGVWRAVLLSGLVFGLMHLNIVQAFYATILGILIGLAVLATRSLWAGVIIHFCNNAIGQLLSYAQQNNWVIADMFQKFLEFFYGMGVVLVFLLIWGLYAAVIAIIHKFARENYKANEKEYFAEFLKKNPDYVAAKMNEGKAVTLEDMAGTVDAYVGRLNKTQAIRFYIEGQRKPQKLDAVEKTMLFGILFLTAVITGMTLVWGLL